MDNYFLNSTTNSTTFFYRLLFAIALFISIPSGAEAQQQNSYEILPAPDVWYNDVDGIRVGLRLRGQVPGTFDDGPHRLDLGVWLGTWFPDNSVSYYLSYTEPIPAISDFGSEGNVQLISSIRTGFQHHSLLFNKRWQPGFEERNYKELSLGLRMEDRFDSEYLLYPQLWTPGTLWLLALDFGIYNEHSLGRYSISTSHSANIAGQQPSFMSSSLQLQQLASLGDHFNFRGRIFTGIASKNTHTEYLFSRSFKQARGWMESGLTRAKGTIPTVWMEEGIFQIAGGPNLRGYLNRDIESLNDASQPAPVLQSIGALNFELDYPNPLNTAVREIPIIGDFVELRSYTFFDGGTSLGIGSNEEQVTIADAGVGFQFSVNIPDYLGKPRGIMIRYDIPLWLSHPGNEKHCKFRNLIGIGAVISL